MGNKTITSKIGEENALLTVREVAEWLGSSPQRISEMAKAGKLPAIKVGRVWRFRVGAMHSWMEKNSNETV